MKKGFNQKGKFLFIFAIFVFAIFLLFFFVKFPTTGNFVKYGSGPYYYNCSSCADCSAAIADASAGDYIFLNQFIYFNSSNCINITNKNNIIFDCNNNAIIGSSGTGVYLYSSNNSKIINCNIIGFSSGNGVGLYFSNNNNLSNLVVNNNLIGIFYLESFYNTLTASHIEGNSRYGLSLYNSYNNLICNNIFNNTNNSYIYSSGPFFSYFNTSGDNSLLNIIRAGKSGGNFWATPTGTGFSQNCTSDVDDDNICDYSYYFNGGSDYLPLIYNTVNITNATACAENWTCTNWTLCNISGIKTRICTDSKGCGTNITRPVLNSTCTYSVNCTENWTCTNWTLCNISGIKTKNCTDSNWCGTNITRPVLNSTCTYSSNCTESWTCAAWSSCANGNQVRTCTDAHGCGTNTTRPALNQACTTNTSNVANNTGALPTEGIGTNVTKNVTTITPTAPAIINIDDSQIYLTKITLNVLESIQSVSVTVTKVNVLSNATLAMGLPSGQFYQAFRIETAGVTNSNIANVTIEFKVNKAWLASKNGTVSGIGLYRRPDTSSEWNNLVTGLTSQDSTYYYFTSVSPGFSTFAVFFKACEGSECGTSSSPSVLIYVLIAVVGIAIIITFFVLIKKMKKKETVVKKV